MKTITIEEIRSYGPCYDPNRHLPAKWRGTALDLLAIDAIPFRDRLWVLLRTDLVSEKLMRLFAVWCARQVEQKDQRCINALITTELFANGKATLEELNAAYSVVWNAALRASRASKSAKSAAYSAAYSAAKSTAESAAESASYSAAKSAAYSAAKNASKSASKSAAYSAAKNAAERAQEQKLREMVIAGALTGDVK